MLLKVLIVPWDLKMDFPGLEKSCILGKMVEFMKKLTEFHIGPNNFVLNIDNSKHPPYHRADIICTKKAWFSAFLSHVKSKLVMEKSLNFLSNCYVNPDGSIAYTSVKYLCHCDKQVPCCLRSLGRT